MLLPKINEIKKAIDKAQVMIQEINELITIIETAYSSIKTAVEDKNAKG